MRARWSRTILTTLAMHLALAGTAIANHDTDCEVSGGTNGPNQLDCTLPDFVARAGSTTPLVSKFVYTPSTDRDPPTCAVGTMSVSPPGQWLSIDTTVLDASDPPFAQEVEVTVDPTGLGVGTYDGTVTIVLQIGTSAPQCPSTPGGLIGVVSVRLIIVAEPAPLLHPAALVFVAIGLLGAGLFAVRRAQRRQIS